MSDTLQDFNWEDRAIADEAIRSVAEASEFVDCPICGRYITHCCCPGSAWADMDMQIEQDYSEEEVISWEL